MPSWQPVAAFTSGWFTPRVAEQSSRNGKRKRFGNGRRSVRYRFPQPCLPPQMTLQSSTRTLRTTWWRFLLRSLNTHSLGRTAHHVSDGSSLSATSIDGTETLQSGWSVNLTHAWQLRCSRVTLQKPKVQGPLSFEASTAQRPHCCIPAMFEFLVSTITNYCAEQKPSNPVSSTH